MPRLRRCSVLNCPNATRKKQDGTYFFNFPKIEVIVESWIKATGRSNWVPTALSALCNLHFVEEDYTASAVRKRLKADVVPTINIHNMLDMRTEDTTHKTAKTGIQLSEAAETPTQYVNRAIDCEHKARLKKQSKRKREQDLVFYDKATEKKENERKGKKAE